MGKHIWCLSSIRASTLDMANMANAKYLAIGIWHICHIKHKNETLSDVPNSKNYKTPLQYKQMLQNFLLFYILFSLSSLFIFSFLFSLIHRFPRSSPCTSSLSLWLVRDVHRQRRWSSFNDDSALHHARSHPRLAMLDLADLTLFPLLFVRLSLCLSLVGFFFFFFFSTIWVVGCGGRWWVVGYGRWQWHWWWAVGVMASSGCRCCWW